MKFNGKPITDASKLPPCMFSDIYSAKKDKLGGTRRKGTRRKGARRKGARRKGTIRRTSRKGGSGKEKNVSFKNAGDDIYSMLTGTVDPSSVLRLDNTLPPISISVGNLLEEGRSVEIQPYVSNTSRSPYSTKKKSNLKKKGGKRRTRKSKKSNKK